MLSYSFGSLDLEFSISLKVDGCRKQLDGRGWCLKGVCAMDTVTCGSDCGIIL